MENMRAVVYGGGNIGRGFIGPLFRQSGYDITFIDVAQSVIQGLNERGEYPLRILTNAGHQDIVVDGVDAVDGNDAAASAKAIASAGIMATAVGVNALKFIVPNLVAGFRERFDTTDRPLNIILCENLLDADKILAGMIKEHFTEFERALYDERIGLIEASIGCMAPIQTETMKDGAPLRVCVERYHWLPVDRDAFKGAVPNIAGLVPFSPFGFYIKRKLFIHNLGHSICAYLGLYSGHHCIWQAIDDPEILLIVKNAMLESARALSMEYDVPMQELLPHIDDLLLRFKNRALGDTCTRVGRDLPRKLGANDRLVGAVRLCEKHGVNAHHSIVGIAAGLYRFLYEQGQPQSEARAAAALTALTGIRFSEPLYMSVMETYRLFMGGTRPEQLRRMIEESRDKEKSNWVF